MIISYGKRINLGRVHILYGDFGSEGPTTTLTITQLTVWRLWTVFCSVVKNALLAAHFLSRGGSRGRVQGCARGAAPPPMTWGFLIQLVFCKIYV